MTTMPAKSFFSIAFELINLNIPMTYSLYINSSSKESREHFVKVFPKGDSLSQEEVDDFHQKYRRLYVLEDERGLYLKSLAKVKNAPPEKKVEIIKDSAIEYLGHLFDSEKEFTTELLEETINGCRDSVEGMIDVIQDYNIDDIQKLIGSLSFHDFYTYDHSINVAMYCISIFNEIRPDASKEEVTMAGLGGMLHDIGKINISTTIINNPGQLTNDQFAQIQKHPIFGKKILEENDVHECCDVDFDILKRVVSEHHENYDGTGYPFKISGENLHLFSKITAIADFFDAITTKRSYHEALSTEDAINVMEKSVGKKIDPEIFEFLKKKVFSPKGLGGKSTFSKYLESDFDPCMPHSSLPFQHAVLNGEDAIGKNKGNFGKIKVEGDGFLDSLKKLKK